ncbi:MAG: ATP-binding protein, partial [Desulfobulbaceae bacterium]|nr:ATP-binding protein [Desulfobulbaceae bacterium]
VFTAEDGLYALDVLETITPDIIFVDLVMPNIDGKKLCKIIRGIEKFQDTYLIILSATATEERIDVEKLGVNACIAKGSLERMEQLIHEVLDHPDAAALRCRAGEVIGAEKSIPRTITNELLNVGKHFEAILEVINEGIIEVASTGRIICVNPAAVSLFGVHKSRLLGSDFFNLFSETDRPEVLAVCENRKESETTNSKCMVHMNSRLVILRTLLIKTGKEFTFFIILNDVTEERRMETQRIQTKKREAIGLLAAGVAHNFNNLLMAIQGNISILMLKEGFNQEDRDRLKTIKAFVESGSKLTGQLIGLAKDGDWEVKPTDVNKIIEKCSGMFGRTHSEVLIHQKYQEGIWVVNADPGQMEQVFFNLFVNAQQAMPGGGELFLETQNITLDENCVRSLGINGSNFVKISVRDTGNGMDKETKERIFDPLFTTRKATMGTGLGLSSVYSTIRDHNGMITVQSKKKKGTLFNIFLPVPANQLPVEEHSRETIDMEKEPLLFVENEE